MNSKAWTQYFAGVPSQSLIFFFVFVHDSFMWRRNYNRPQGDPQNLAMHFTLSISAKSGITKNLGGNKITSSISLNDMKRVPF